MEKAVAANLKYAVTAFFIIQWYKRGAAYNPLAAAFTLATPVFIGISEEKVKGETFFAAFYVKHEFSLLFMVL